MREQTLPQRPRLRPGVAVLRRRAGEIQVGLHPRRAAVVSGLPDPVVAAATGLDGGHTTAELLAALGSAHRPTMRALLADLASHGLVEDAAAPGTPVPRRLAADQTTAALRAPVAALADRSKAAVHLRGNGRIAVALACLLAAAGIGRLHVSAEGTVTAEDVGAGLRPADIGRPRQAAAHDAVHRTDDTVRTQRFTRKRPDLVILTDALVPDPHLVISLIADAVPHLCVRVRDGVGIVGPMVVPGITSCLRCADRHRADIDPCWPTVAAQLAGRTQLVDLATVHATAGVAAAQVIDALGWLHAPDPNPPAVWNAAIEIDPFAATVEHRPWTPHPACDCRAATHPTYRRPRSR
ncbi:ThiF family adenylyltransferase [Actinokineospora iranica]|uniref:ThiF family protein n=1 Tax=Actinokineospora iranica TaxID=1271860 RepID=A0A1G6YGM5_9PSEU|nr:ThiF family adenylyltransferase [Actinokineospora iranica]SDD88706.1 ThiF family protein [Actinokineospora iranica]